MSNLMEMLKDVPDTELVEPREEFDVPTGEVGILIQYKGGGYDGCFWEWNYGFVTPALEFKDIHSSGRKGIKDRTKFIDSLQEGMPNYHYVLPDEWDEFANSSNPLHVVGVGEWLDKNGIMTPEMTCKECGGKISLVERGLDSGEYSLTDWHGCGGIASAPDSFVCLDCQGCCDKCGADYLRSELDENYLCENCGEEV